MIKTLLPFVPLPEEFVTLLKTNLSVLTSPSQVFTVIRRNKALYFLLESTFAEFDDGRGLEKTMMALGWPNFKERVASLFVYKARYGSYPAATDLKLVEDIIAFEQQFHGQSVNSVSRLFLLGFYLKLANIQRGQRENSDYQEIRIPEELSAILKLSQGRSEKIDLLILIVFHLYESLGPGLREALATSKTFEEIVTLMPTEDRESMSSNLLAYTASIKEQDLFLYDKV